MKLNISKKKDKEQEHRKDKISPENYFTVSDGQIIKSPEELKIILAYMEQETFKKHVNEDKNDFSDWIRNVFNDKELSENLKTKKTKKEMVEYLRNYYKKKSKENIDRFDKKKESVYEKKIDLNQEKKYSGQEMHNLSGAFKFRLEKTRDKISEFRKKGHDTKICELYMMQIPAKIKMFETIRTERELLKIIHLFFYVEQELNYIKNEDEKTDDQNQKNKNKRVAENIEKNSLPHKKKEEIKND
ncbi:hypothetical protein GF327_06575 [Candidatus Woesearchaeota archaeon]|nr:hypothetical protein [Candidatus Woesearchaeota archaeon]